MGSLCSLRQLLWSESGAKMLGARKRGFLETVKELLRARADPDVGDTPYGRTPPWEAFAAFFNYYGVKAAPKCWERASVVN